MRTLLLLSLVLSTLEPGFAEGSPGPVGTLAFRFRLSRTLRMARAAPITAHAHPILTVAMAADETYHPQGRLAVLGSSNPASKAPTLSL